MPIRRNRCRRQSLKVHQRNQVAAISVSCKESKTFELDRRCACIFSIPSIRFQLERISSVFSASRFAECSGNAKSQNIQSPFVGVYVCHFSPYSTRTKKSFSAMVKREPKINCSKFWHRHSTIQPNSQRATASGDENLETHFSATSQQSEIRSFRFKIEIATSWIAET